MDSELTLSRAQSLVDEWIRTYGEQSFKATDEPANLADELTDVLWVLLCLANQTGVDLEEAFQRNLEKKTRRDRERHRANPKLHESTD